MVRKIMVIAAVVAMVLAMTSVAWAADDSSTAFNTVDLPDGEYEPDSFSWSGGSGRLKSIDCTKIKVEDGGAYATIVFASPNYDHMKVMGKTYKCTEVGEDSSTFRVPVRLNSNMDIEGRTTAMSQPHWIPYRIYVGKKGAKAEGEAVIDTEALQQQNESLKKEPAEEPPVIIGFEGGKRLKTEHARYLRIFRYDGGGALIQVARREASGGNGLYGQKIVNYLVVPEDMEAPAGAEKDFVIIPRGASPVYADSASVRTLLEALHVDLVNDGELAMAEIVKAGTKLCILGEDEASAGVAGKLVTLKIPLFVDRSGDEQGIVAQAEWALAYGEIFGKQEEAQRALEEAEAAAAREQRKQQTAAVILLLGIVCATVLVPVAAKRG